MKKILMINMAIILTAGIVISQANESGSLKNHSAKLTAINISSTHDKVESQLLDLSENNAEFVNYSLNAPPNDDCDNAELINGPFPTNIYGSTIGASVDCPEGFNAEAVWYEFTAPFDRNEITIDYCLTENDQIDFTSMILYSDCPYDMASCADYIETYQAYEKVCPNEYRNAYRRWLGIPGPAVYYLPVYFDEASDFGFTIDIIQFVPANVTCPDGAQLEQEICGDNTNGGCLMEPGMEQFEYIDCGITVCGDYWSNYHTRDTDWYEFELAERGFIRWSAVGEAPTRIWIYDGSEGCNGIFLGSIAAEPGDTASLELELLDGTYWLVVGTDGWFDMPCDGSGMFTNDYTAIVICDLGTPELTVVPTAVYGDALEGFSDIEILSVSNTGTGRLVFIAEATQDISLSYPLENSRINLHDMLSSTAPDYIDEYYNNLPVTFNFNQKQDNRLIPELLVECPPDAVLESEECGDDINGGCAMFPGTESFEPVACNTTVCGTVWSDGTIRDTDWYILELAEPQLFNFSVTADFPFLMFLLLPGPNGFECEDFEALSFAGAVAGDTAAITSNLPAGTYWLWIGPTAWYDQPCDGSGEYGNDYVTWVNCIQPWLTIDIVNGQIHEADPALDITVTMDAANLEPGTYTGNIRFISNDYTQSPFDIPVTFEVNEVYAYIPGDANMSVGSWPAALTGGDVSYLIGYFDMATHLPPCYFDGFYAAADANGDCIIIGGDVTYLVGYLLGYLPAPVGCPLFPHIDPVEENYPACVVPSYDTRNDNEQSKTAK